MLLLLKINKDSGWFGLKVVYLAKDGQPLVIPVIMEMLLNYRELMAPTVAFMFMEIQKVRLSVDSLKCQAIQYAVVQAVELGSPT